MLGIAQFSSVCLIHGPCPKQALKMSAVFATTDVPVLAPIWSKQSRQQGMGLTLHWLLCLRLECLLAMPMLSSLPSLQAVRRSWPTPISQWTLTVTQQPAGKQQVTAYSTPGAFCTASAAGCSSVVAALPLSHLPCPVHQSPGACSLT